MNNLKKILVVEDSNLVRQMYDLIFMSFRMKGGKIIHATNGHEALDLLHENTDIDLIILDINMPVMNGLQFLLHRKKNNEFLHIPVVIITTEGSEEATIKGLEAGADAYLYKPFQATTLYKVIDKLFEEKK